MNTTIQRFTTNLRCEGCVAANSAYVFVRKPPRVTMGELYT